MIDIINHLNLSSVKGAVVNIDNGFGAGYMSTQINRLAVDKNE